MKALVADFHRLAKSPRARRFLRVYAVCLLIWSLAAVPFSPQISPLWWCATGPGYPTPLCALSPFHLLLWLPVYMLDLYNRASIAAWIVGVAWWGLLALPCALWWTPQRAARARTPIGMVVSGVSNKQEK